MQDLVGQSADLVITRAAAADGEWLHEKADRISLA
jgi:hypothetical protein